MTNSVIFVTGGCGFIGTNFIHTCIERFRDASIVNLDALTYAGNPSNLDQLSADRYRLIHGDINDASLVKHIFDLYKPAKLINFAAETHVDRSIAGPGAFIRTNIDGTYTLLNAAYEYWQGGAAPNFSFLHVSTDEVFGSLGPNDPPFTESTPYAPNSPYSASKASADMLVRAWHRTYGLPTVITNCSNNYGPYQYPEKLIPLVISNILNKKPIPIYGDGKNIRDWLYVEDHCRALGTLLYHGQPGETYNIGGDSEKTNIEIVELICEFIKPYLQPKFDPKTLITYVEDRKGHDRRYAIDASKIHKQIGWFPTYDFDYGLLKTVQWYCQNQVWLNKIR